MKLATNPKRIEVMQQDLTDKVQDAINCNPDLRMAVYKVFGVDQLENMLASDLGGFIGVGVQYLGCQRQTKDDRTGTFGAAGGNTIRSLLYSFHVLLAVPVNANDNPPPAATELLTILRDAILGKPITEDRMQRPWDFVMERPEVGASTETMLYYSQLWQVALQNHGTAS
jgi:hypothetical protein